MFYECFATRAGALSLLGLGFLTASPVGAQDVPGAQGASLEEIYVTGRRREETILEVPVSVSVMSGEMLDRLQIDSPEELMAYTPGFQFSQVRGGRFMANPGIRGIQPDTQDINSQKIAVLIDGAPMTGNMGYSDFVDIEGVELYRGPQAASFGPNTFVGAINYRTIDPSDTLTARARLGFGGDGTEEGGFRVSGPITDTLGYVFGVNHRNYEGPSEWISTNEGAFYGVPEFTFQHGSERTDTLAAKLKWTPSDKITATFRYSALDAEDTAGADYYMSPIFWDLSPGVPVVVPETSNNWHYLVPVNPANPGVSPVVLGDIDPIGPEGRVLHNYDDQAGPYLPIMYGNRWHFTGQVDWLLPSDYTVTFVGSGGRDNREWGNDTDGMEVRESWAAGAHGISGFPEDLEERYGEVRVNSPDANKFRWNLGYSWYHFDHFRRRAALTFLPSPAPPTEYLPSTREELTHQGIFAGTFFDVTDKLTLSFEGRYLTEDVDSIAVGETADRFTATTDDFVPRVALDYQFTDNFAFYVQAAKGIIPARSNLANIEQTDKETAVIEGYNLSPFEATEKEELWNYEVGLKGAFLDQKLSLAIALYEMQWDNRVWSTTVSWDPGVSRRSINPATGVPYRSTDYQSRVVGNSAGATNHGLELEGTYFISNSWNMRFTLAFVDASLGDFCTPSEFADHGLPPDRGPAIDGFPYNCKLLTGNEIPQMPDLTGSIGVGYTRDMSSGWEIGTRFDTQYRGQYFYDLLNNGQGPARVTADLSLSLSNGRWQVEGYVQNLFDDDTPRTVSIGSDRRVSFFPTPTTADPRFNSATELRSNAVNIFPSQPRTAGVRLTYDF
jgi:iron complex outermembrane recepter protein